MTHFLYLLQPEGPRGDLYIFLKKGFFVCGKWHFSSVTVCTEQSVLGRLNSTYLKIMHLSSSSRT